MFYLLKVCAGPNVHAVLVICHRYQIISHSLQQVNSNSPAGVNNKFVDVYTV